MGCEGLHEGHQVMEIWKRGARKVSASAFANPYILPREKAVGISVGDYIIEIPIEEAAVIISSWKNLAFTCPEADLHLKF